MCHFDIIVQLVAASGVAVDVTKCLLCVDMDKKLASESGEGGDDSSAETVVVRPHSPSIIDTGPNLDRLWAYHCALTKDHNISCVSWNRVNPVRARS